MTLTLDVRHHLVIRHKVVIHDCTDGRPMCPFRAAIAPRSIVDDVVPWLVRVLPHRNGLLHTASFNGRTDFGNHFRAKAWIVFQPRLMGIFVNQSKVQLFQSAFLSGRLSLQEARKFHTTQSHSARLLRRHSGFLGLLVGIGAHWITSIFSNTY
ncbi:hypothetical protein D3C76_1412510 [compost metagenome]